VAAKLRTGRTLAGGRREGACFSRKKDGIAVDNYLSVKERSEWHKVKRKLLTQWDVL